MKNKIVFMLDIQGTINELDEVTQKKFIEILKLYKEKFDADKIELFLSTSADEDLLKYYVDIIAKDIIPEISISKNFYYGGIYNYQNKSVTFIDRNYNYNKIEPLKEHYLDENVKFIGIIDDNLPEFQLAELKGIKIATLFSPSSKVLKTPMHYGTSVFGIKGVLELLENYFQSIQNLSSEEILEEQKNCKLVVGYDSSLRGDIIKQYDNLVNVAINDGETFHEEALKFASKMYNLLNNCELSSEAINFIDEYSKIIVSVLEETSIVEEGSIVYKLKNKEY